MLKFNTVILLASLLLTGCSMKDVNKDESYDPASSLAVSSSTPEDTVNRHNEIRAEVFSGSKVAWSKTIAASAQRHADYLASAGEFQHASTKYGENLYASTGSIGYLDAIYSWNHEKSKYNYANNSCDGVCGHYTQLVWKNSQEIGCGKATYTKGGYKGGTVVVCRYSPAGNFMGERPY